VVDPHDTPGAHDYQELESRKDLLTFETETLPEDLWVVGDVTAVILASCDCRDFDLWVRLQDVHPDGRAFNLMSPGNDVLRASNRDPEAGQVPLEPGQVYELRLPGLMTSNRFAKGHRIRVQISGSFYPHLSRNLQTGQSEVVSAASRPAAITIHHEAGNASRLLLPVEDEQATHPH
jgi:putative CocE/NonD family hydrolase